MNVLITGSSGFIASELIKKAPLNWNVIGISKSGISNAKENYKVDLTSSEFVKTFIENTDFNIDLIIHTASILANANNVRSLNLFYGNMAITENVIRIIKEKKVPRLINISSVAVYPNVDGNFNEASEIKPSVNNDCLYGLSKFCSENVFDFLLNDTATQILHLRVSQVFGATMHEDRTYKIMLKELKDFNRITVFGEGKRVSNFIHIDLLIKYILFSVDQNLNGIYNIGGENVSYLEFAENVIKEMGISSAQIILEQKGVRSKTLIDTSKFNEFYSSTSKNI